MRALDTISARKCVQVRDNTSGEFFQMRDGV